MALDDYIRDQEKKAKETAEDVRASASDAWDDTKEAASEAKERAQDYLNG